MVLLAKDQSFLSFEEGENRVLYEPVGKDKLVIVNDGFVHLNAANWKGAGVAIPVFSLRSNKSAGVGEFARQCPQVHSPGLGRVASALD
jgi:4-alpha-glucanotransferase